MLKWYGTCHCAVLLSGFLCPDRVQRVCGAWPYAGNHYSMCGADGLVAAPGGPVDLIFGR